MRTWHVGIILFALGIFSSGCTVAYNTINTMVTEPAEYPTYFEFVLLKMRTCKLAAEAWKEVRTGVPGYSRHYHRGFLVGFADYLQFGGNGEPPPVPPRQYWKQDSPAGRQAVEDWFSGFRHGATIARRSGYRELIVVPVSAALSSDQPEQSPEIRNEPMAPDDGADNSSPLPQPREIGPNAPSAQPAELPKNGP